MLTMYIFIIYIIIIYSQVLISIYIFHASILYNQYIYKYIIIYMLKIQYIKDCSIFDLLQDATKIIYNIYINFHSFNLFRHS